MHSVVNRAQAVFGFFTTVAFVVAGLAALSVFLYPATEVSTSVELNNVQVYVFSSATSARKESYSSRAEQKAGRTTIHPNGKNTPKSNSTLRLVGSPLSLPK
jgi:hypothetical protein